MTIRARTRTVNPLSSDVLITGAKKGDEPRCTATKPEDKNKREG